MGRFALAVAEGILPPKIISVSQWADENRILSGKGSSEPGKFRTDRTPYIREIQDTLSLHDPTRRVVVMKASQVGVSEAAMNAIGHTICFNPCPILVIYPVEALAKKMSRIRFDPMIEASPRLRDLVASKRSRDSGNTELAKEFVGGNITFGGASSPNALSSISAALLIPDEVDRMPLDVSSEGDPLFLASQRAAAFSRHKIVMISTPTRSKTSTIYQEFEESDKRKYMIPCPHCGHRQELILENFHYEKADRYCPDAWFQCTGCQGRIEETDKAQFLPAGKWVATAESPVAGFHISQFYMPLGWKSWKAIAYEYYARAMKDKEIMIAFRNTVLGLPWEDAIDRPDAQNIFDRKEPYKVGVVQPGTLFLSCGVDVQGDRLEAHVVGWGRDKQCWSTDYQILYGDTDSEAVWDKLTEALNKTYPSECGTYTLPIQITAIDTGYRTEKVYNFVKKFGARCIAAKGDDRLHTPIGRPSITEVDSKGRSYKKGIHLWPVGVDYCKTDLYDRLNLRKDPDTQKFPSHYAHFPEYQYEFFKQLVAEAKVLRVSRTGRRNHQWIKVYERNEALDTWVYARAAACKFGIDRFDDSEWSKLEASICSPASASEPIQQSADVGEKVIKIVRKSKSSYWT